MPSSNGSWFSRTQLHCMGRSGGHGYRLANCIFELTFHIEFFDLWVSFQLHETLNSVSLSVCCWKPGLAQSWLSSCYMRLCTGPTRGNRARFPVTSALDDSSLSGSVGRDFVGFAVLQVPLLSSKTGWQKSQELSLPYSLVIRALSAV